MTVVACACIGLFPARAETLTLTYVGEAYRVVVLGEAALSVRLSDDGYAAQGRIRSGGLGALFADTDLTARAAGRRGAPGLGPEVYELDHAYAGLKRRVEVRRGAAGVIARAQPAFGFDGDPAPSEVQKASGHDPLSTLVSIGLSVAVTRACPASQRVFDGRYVYDLSFNHVRMGSSSLHAYRGATLSCRMRQTRIAGYRARSDLQKRLPDGEITFALEAHPHFAPPIRVSAPTPLGQATIRLRHIQRTP